MQELTDRMVELGRRAETAVSALWAAVQAGDLEAAVFVPAAAELVRTVNTIAETAADVAVWTELARAGVNAAIPGTVAAAATDPARITAGLQTILDGPADAAETRLARYAKAEPRTAAQNRAGALIADQPNVIGWRRGLDPDPCQLCQWWSRDGTTWPKRHPMPTHPGCACVQIPVIAGGSKQ